MPTFWKMLMAMLMIADSLDSSSIILFTKLFHSKLNSIIKPLVDSILLCFLFDLGEGGLYLGEVGPALGALIIYFGPVLDALAVEEVLARRIYRVHSFLVMSQTDRAHQLGLHFLGDVIEPVAFPTAVRGRSVNGILIVKGLNQSHLPQGLLSLPDEPLFYLKAPQSQ